MTTLSIALGDLADPCVIRLLEDHLADMHATSPAESVHALDVSGPRASRDERRGGPAS